MHPLGGGGLICARVEARTERLGGPFCLEAFSPIAGTTLGVGNGDDLNVVQAFAEDHRERIALED